MTDLSYECSWDTVIALDDWLGPNTYKCEIYFDIETDDPDQQNTAFERCKIFLEHIFNNALFINLNNPLVQTLSKKTKQKIITLPNEPIDVIVAAILYHKLNSICEGRLHIEKIKLSSKQGENIFVHFDSQFAEGFGSLNCEYYETVKEKPWWYREDPAVSDWFEISVKQKELKFHFHKCSWDKTLQWGQEVKETKIKSWKPEIINGGKETKH